MASLWRHSPLPRPDTCGLWRHKLTPLLVPRSHHIPHCYCKPPLANACTLGKQHSRNLFVVELFLLEITSSSTIPWCRAFLEMLTVAQLVKIFPASWKLKVRYRIQKSAQFDPLLNQLNPFDTPHISCLYVAVCYPYIYTLVSRVVSSLEGCRLKCFIHFPFHICVLHVPPISVFFH
jgi:hypothetical protein